MKENIHIIPRGKILLDGEYIGNSTKRFEWRNVGKGKDENGNVRYDRGLYLIVCADDIGKGILDHLKDAGLSVVVSYEDSGMCSHKVDFNLTGTFESKVCDFSPSAWLNVEFTILVDVTTLEFKVTESKVSLPAT